MLLESNVDITETVPCKLTAEICPVFEEIPLYGWCDSSSIQFKVSALVSEESTPICWNLL